MSDFTEAEQRVIKELAKKLDVSEHKVLVQGLRILQLIVIGTHKLVEVNPELKSGPAPAGEPICIECNKPFSDEMHHKWGAALHVPREAGGPQRELVICEHNTKAHYVGECPVCEPQPQAPKVVCDIIKTPHERDAITPCRNPREAGEPQPQESEETK